jgi:GDPmannose 4,6-dehydratase
MSQCDEIAIIAAVSGKETRCSVRDDIAWGYQRYFLPSELETLLGDPGKPQQKLGWAPRTTLAELVHEMVECDYLSARRDHLVRQAGYRTFDHHE